jgi:hypothetical protein
VAQPGAGQSGTEQSPWFVRVLPQPETVAEAAAEKREQDARAANERGVTKYARYLWVATAALTLVGAIQAGLFGTEFHAVTDEQRRPNENRTPSSVKSRRRRSQVSRYADLSLSHRSREQRGLQPSFRIRP